MAKVKVTTNIWMTGLGSEDSLKNTYTSSIAPEESAKLKTVVNDTVDIAPANVTMSSAYGVLIKAISNTVYVGINATAIDCSACQFVLSVGASNFYSFNTNVTAVVSVVAMVSAGTGLIEYLVVAT